MSKSHIYRGHGIDVITGQLVTSFKTLDEAAEKIGSLHRQVELLEGSLAFESAKRADLERQLSSSPNAIDSTLDSLDSRRQEACWNAYKETVARLTNGGSQREDIDTLLACLEDGGYLEIQQEIALIAIRKEADSLREQNAKLAEAAKAAAKMIEGLQSFYGQGLEVANWHHNGDTEPLDSFFDDNSTGNELELLRAALADPAIQPKEPDHECD
jgi:hypothetical protein